MYPHIYYAVPDPGAMLPFKPPPTNASQNASPCPIGSKSWIYPYLAQHCRRIPTLKKNPEEDNFLLNHPLPPPTNRNWTARRGKRIDV